MAKTSERDGARDLRSSALWGKGGRGGDGRSNARGRTGSGGTTVAVIAAAALALTAPLAATADPGHGRHHGFHNRNGSYVAPDLAAKARNHPNDLVSVIIQSTRGQGDALRNARGLGPLMHLRKSLDLVDGVSVRLPARLVDRLSRIPGLSVTLDAPVESPESVPSWRDYSVWPTGGGRHRGDDDDAPAPTIAIVDSGIEADRPDFDDGARVVANVNLSSLDTNTPDGDGNGHGTFVAGIAAGSARHHLGAAPNANIVALDVMDDQGKALTSDVIAACSWLIEHKDEYGIRVANFSLHSAYPSNFGHDPLDQAVEKLWLDGITVVAAAGNYGNADGSPSGVHYAPGNDPFVITVGAVDPAGRGAAGEGDTVASWSAYGYTYDGFWKPDVSAVGRHMIGPVPDGSTLPEERPDDASGGYMQLSGTSFAAPVVSGAAAEILARHPEWTPDQVKGALMATARPIGHADNFQGGVGEVDPRRAMRLDNPPNPNAALQQFVHADPAGGAVPIFDADEWYDAAQANPAWDDVSWSDVSWSDVSWSSVSWSDVSWSDVSWADVSWSDVSWADVSWADSAKEQRVEVAVPVDAPPAESDDSDASDPASSDP